MSTSSSARQGGQRTGFASIAGLLSGVVLACAAGALVYDSHFAGSGLFGPAADNVALGMGVLGAALFLVNLAPAVRFVRPRALSGETTVMFGAGVLDDVFAQPYEGDIAFRLSEPNGGKISLLDAVRRAHQEAGPTDAGAFAEYVAESADDIVTMYATFFAEHVPLYGCRRPFADIEQMSMTNPLKEFAVEGGVLVLKERQGSAVYDGLMIKAADYPLMLRHLRSAR